MTTADEYVTADVLLARGGRSSTIATARSLNSAGYGFPFCMDSILSPKDGASTTPRAVQFLTLGRR